MSDLVSEDQTEVECSECGEEFPAYVYNSAGSCQITLDDYPGTSVQADIAFFSAPDDDDWLDYEISDDPHVVFMDSYHQTGEILADHGGVEGTHLINRMVFAQQVSALEAYLGDTLIRAVQQKPAARSGLLKADKDLNNEKFTLAEIADNPDLISDKMTGYLRKILYHNLPKVDFLYRSALGIRLLSDEGVNTKLMQAIHYRHDCVHRNGIDSEGRRLDVFTKSYVQEVADLMLGLVNRIENELWAEAEF